MTKTWVGRRRLLVVCLAAIATIGALGWWQLRSGRVLTAAELLSDIPSPSDPSPTDKAVTLWAARARQDPRSSLAWTNLGDVLMQKSRETMDVAYYGRAEAAFRQALAISPDNTPAITGIAWVHGSRHEFERSIEWARKALAVDPKSQDAYGLMGDAAVEMGDYEGAFKDYQRMIDIRPDLSSYSRGAHLLFLSGNTRKAIWLMEKAIAAGAPHAENTAWCRAQLALMQWNTGELITAEQTAAAGLALAPTNYHLLAAMGRIKTARQEYDAAIDYYSRASAAVPHHEVVVALGDLYSLLGRQDDARKQYALVQVIHDANRAKGVQGNGELARFYADHDQNLAEAVSLAEAEYKSRPNVLAADTLAWCYYKRDRPEDAKKMIEKALKLGTPDAMFLFHAGMIHARLGDRVTAQEFLYRAVSLNPNFHPLYAKIATDTLAKLGS
jgi:tetratricopeptide (TPR) repeat protein